MGCGLMWCKRAKYRRAMLAAIDAAAGRPDPWPYVNSCTRLEGLRTIRHFEAVNGVTFDPFDAYHVRRVSGMARFGAIIRKMHRRSTLHKTPPKV